MDRIFQRAIDARWEHYFENHYRPEWVHAEPFTLTPMSIDPQRRDNLGAAPKWANTEMMVLSHIVVWFAKHCPDAIEKITPLFRMLPATELIDKINYEVSIEEQGHIVRMFQIINPLKKGPVFRKPTDLTQATAVVNSMLCGIPPISSTGLTFFTPVNAKRGKKHGHSEVEEPPLQGEEKRAKM